jgi:excisionase family DNA binding protein
MNPFFLCHTIAMRSSHPYTEKTYEPIIGILVETPKMPDKLMTIEEVAEVLSVSTTTVRSKHFRNRVGLNIIRVGRSIRFSRQELESWISRHVEVAEDQSIEEGEGE